MKKTDADIPVLLPEDVPHRWRSVRSPTRPFQRTAGSSGFKEGMLRTAERELAKLGYPDPADAAQRLLAGEQIPVLDDTDSSSASGDF